MHREYRTREDSWLRARDVGEKWPRFCGEVPPELAAELDKRVRRIDGPRSRADMVQAGLRLYLNAVSPEPAETIDTTAVDIVELRALPRGGGAANPQGANDQFPGDRDNESDSFTAGVIFPEETP